MALTTMMKQYLQIKEDYKDAILLYRLGDFYEMFFNDAIVASEALGLTLTGRDCGLSERAPMCGVPFHSITNYLVKLIESGYKAAICEQVSKPGDQKGIVDRRVVKVITKGTLIDSNFLNETSNNYLVSVYYDETNYKIGVAWSDVSTGELGYQSIDGKINHKLNELLSMLSPSEIICNEAMLKESVDLSIVKYGSVCPFSLYSELAFDYKNAYAESALYFSTDKSKKIQGEKECVCALGALLNYIKATQMKTLSHLSFLEGSDLSSRMSLDSATRKNLEIIETIDRRKKGSLLWVLDRTSTPMGARCLKSWLMLPLINETEINIRLDCVEELISNQYLTDEIVSLLKKIKDLERLNARISSSDINPKECLALASSLDKMPALKSLLNNTKSIGFKKIDEQINNFEQLTKMLLSAIDESAPNFIRDGGFIKAGYDAELDDYRNLNLNAKTILKQLEQDEKEETGIKNLKIGYNKVFGYYIEVSKSQLSSIPYRYIRKQTIAGGERFITEELKELEQKILGSEERAVAREILLFKEITDHLQEFVKEILDSAKGIANLDCLISHAVISKENSYVKPLIGKKYKQINLIESRHPVVEALIKKENFVPNDVLLDANENRINLITGPNMAGKSIYMRQVALVTIMAHIGCFVPAKSAEICLVDKIFTRIGASDDLGSGRSTFMVEMSEVANILENATEDSLLLFDEVGRGTSTYDGLSIAWALLEHLSANYKSKIMFSTHYHELTELESSLDGLKNYKLTIREVNNDIIFLRKVMRGSANKSFGIEVASLSGLPTDLIMRAKEILKKLEFADINNKNISAGKQLSMFDNRVQSEIVSIIKDIDTDNISPRSALDILIDLKEKALKF